MSEKPLEDLKRICLICGCHTNQTINIFEPRSGPNIVELIQVKFKFQPLNEDKYLCYSCNNWLINWHSLQAVNCNDESENQSGKFRCQINGAIPEEELDKFQRMPHLSSIETMPNSQLKINATSVDATDAIGSQPKSARKGNGLRFAKRSSVIDRNRKKKIRRKCIPSNCRLCGRIFTKRLPPQLRCSTKIRWRSLKCVNCSRFLRWQRRYLKALFEEEERKLRRKNRVNGSNDLSNCTLQQKHEKENPYAHKSSQHEPPVDGKVVSMLKRLGTTLSPENPHSMSGDSRRRNMNSPQKPKWSVKLPDDVILINFKTALTEVLPFRHYYKQVRYQFSTLRKFEDLETIEIHSDEESDEFDNYVFENVVNGNFDDDEEEGYCSGSEHDYVGIDLEAIYGKIPKGLTVSLINNEGDNGQI